MSEMVDAANRWVKKHEYLHEVALLPITIDKIFEGATLITELPENIDEGKEQFSNRIPLLHSVVNFNVAEVAGNLLQLIPNLDEEKDLPEEIRENAKKLSSLDDEERVNLVNDVLEGNEEWFLKISQKLDIDPNLLLYFTWTTIKYAISPLKADLRAWVDKSYWQHDYCPVCGNHPSSALMKKEKRGKQRFLHCEHCGTDWSYKRVGCPYCGNIDQKDLAIKDTENDTDLRVDLCNKCNTYLKTYIGGEKVTAGTSDWATIHLDLLMKDSGYTKKGGLLNTD